MNIFATSIMPGFAAAHHCDRHLGKMLMETAQILATSVRMRGGTDEDMPLTTKGTPYAMTHEHHPCCRWARASRPNFLWLAELGRCLGIEWEHRRGKEHAAAAACRHFAQEHIAQIIPDIRCTDDRDGRRPGRWDWENAVVVACDETPRLRNLVDAPPLAMPDEFKREGPPPVRFDLDPVVHSYHQWRATQESYRDYIAYGKQEMNDGAGPQWLWMPDRRPDWFADRVDGVSRFQEEMV